MTPPSAIPPDLRSPLEQQLRHLPPTDVLKRPAKPTAPAKKPATKPVGLKPVDPYANPQQYIQQAVARLGNPLTDAQIQANAQGQLSPLIQALTDSIGRQAQVGTAAIGGYTSEFAKHLAPFQQNAANIYSGAEQSQAASDATLAAKLQGGGAQQAQDLGARLAGINAPGATNAAVQDATQTGAGAGNALYATGSASLANLIASGAAEQSYAGKLPGLAGLQGGQQVGGLQAQLAGKLADQTGTLQAKVPDIVSGLQGQRSNLLSNREKLRADLAGFFSTREKQAEAIAQEKRIFDANSAKAGQSASYQNASLTERQRHDVATERAAQQRLSQQAQAAAAKAAKPAVTKPPKVNTTLSAANKYLTDNAGNPVLKNGQRQPYKPAPTGAAANPKGPLGLSPKDYQEKTARALGAARTYHSTWKDADGKEHPPLSWQEYLTHGESAGIPIAILIGQGKKVYSAKERKGG